MRNTFIILNIFFAQLLNAKIITVSNNPSQPAQFSTSSAALAASSDGDTLYFHGSPTSYGNSLNINKKLVILGPGRFPQGENSYNAHFRNIVANTAGSVIMGMTAGEGFSISSNSTTVVGCRIFSMHLNGHSNVFIRDCVIANTSTLINNFAIFFSGSETGVRFENCLIYGAIDKSRNVQFYNCVFTKGVLLFNTSGTSNTFENCIFYGPSINTCSSCIFNNNLTFGGSNTDFPSSFTGTANLTNSDPQFENAPLSYNATVDWQYNFQLKSSSPAKNKGKDGKDMGLYGGNNPFSRMGYNGLPIVESVDISNSIVPPGGKVKATIYSNKP